MLVAELNGFTPALCTHGDVVEELLGAELGLKKGAARVLRSTTASFGRASTIPPPA